MVLTVRGGNHHANTGFAARYGWEAKRSGKNAFVIELSAEFPRQLNITEHNRSDRRLGGAGIEAEFAHFLLEEARVDETDKDYKTRLQEYVQKGHIGKLEYECRSVSGPEHQKRFTICALLSGEEIGVGEGANKQSAGQEAAKDALIKLGVLEDESCV